MGGSLVVSTAAVTEPAPNSRRYLGPFTSQPVQRGHSPPSRGLQCLGRDGLESRSENNPSFGTLSAQRQERVEPKTQITRSPRPFSLVNNLIQKLFIAV